jgi:DNA-binding MarR family transcriptional regulator
MDLVDEITQSLARRHSTATVLMHHAVAERLGLGPTDHKCLDLLREHGPMSGSRLASLTGLTSGAVTGVVARLERAGYVRRAGDPDDRRRHVLHAVPERVEEISAVFAPLQDDLASLLEGFEPDQLEAVARFLRFATDRSFQHAARLRSDARSGVPKGGS